MEASNIGTIIDNFKLDKNPYQCILISGPWGIGKTHAIKAACANDTYISLFGTSSADDIYKMILTKGVSSECFAKGIPIVTRLTNGLIKKFFGVDPATIFSGIFSLKEIVLRFLDNSSQTLIVFDDFERKSPDLKIEDVLGVIDSLRNLRNTKIIIVTNQDQMEDIEKFNIYCEKVVERIYQIDQISIKTLSFVKPCDYDFIDLFVTMHGVKNLRTIQKAQSFFNDVCMVIPDLLDNSEFKEQVRLICYSVVVEQIEQVYLQQIDNELSNYLKKLCADDAWRITYKYIHPIIPDANLSNLTKVFLDYYVIGENLNRDVIKAYLEILLNTGKKHNYYKSQQEIEEMISHEIPILKNTTLPIEETLERLQVVLIWQEILEAVDNDFVNYMYQKLFQRYVKLFHFNPTIDEKFYELSHSFSFEGVTINKMLDNLRTNLENNYWDLFCKKFTDSVNSQTFCSGKKLATVLHERITPDPTLRDTIAKKMLPLVTTSSIAPLGSITPEHNMCFSRFVELLAKYQMDSANSFLDACLNLDPSNRVLAHRIKTVKNEYHITEPQPLIKD